MSSQDSRSANPRRKNLLRNALLGNAAFSTLTGFELLAFPEAMGRFIGFQSPALLRELGASLLFFAAVVAFTATRRPIRLWAAATISAMDISWVVGTAALLIARPDLLNTAGTITALVVAFVVADFALFQIIGIRRLTSTRQQRDHGGGETNLASATSA